MSDLGVARLLYSSASEQVWREMRSCHMVTVRTAQNWRRAWGLYQEEVLGAPPGMLNEDEQTLRLLLLLDHSTSATSAA